MAETYSVPAEAHRVLHEGIFGNPRVAHNVPGGAAEIAAQSVRFKGNDQPSVPVNWRFAESAAALKAYEASVLSLLVRKKYGVDAGEVIIDTDHASLFFMSPIVAQVIGQDGKPTPFSPLDPRNHRIIPNYDKHDSTSLYRGLTTSIYRTKDGRFFHLHGSLNPDASLAALGLPIRDDSATDFDTCVGRIQEKVLQHESGELDELMNEKHRQAGCVGLSMEEYFASESGRANHKAGLYELSHFDYGSDGGEGTHLPAAWWPEQPSRPSSATRPLAGLKVVDLTRVIAGPSMTRALAEMGASVMRVTSPNLADLSAVHHDLSWGKWSCHLDLDVPGDCEKLWALIREADVVVDGYRPGAMDRRGFGRDAVLAAARIRGRGIVYARENCYGWHGPWMHRSGWQQISDMCCGISMGFGRAMGLDEPVTPVFPNSDFCTGIIGCVGILHALILRAEKGGSYGVDTALNYYSTWLAESVGEYPAAVWQDLWQRHDNFVLHHYENMQHMFPKLMPIMHHADGAVLFKPQFFEQRKAAACGEGGEGGGVTFVLPRPIADFTGGTVELKYDVGTRGNGVDAPVWPEDLNVEVVKV
ncbi:CoA-transferase family III domain-containing protein [Microdochium trichocladiopsis]|uniref:CoA-transferase family III domain-containing protein n=1 Tax=Microdochium trichocladiopsis TaxID=1682393 RepID=A0A9P8Y0U2_9PEZI|nr:CoA-transferase family III domain-containing protein [Microdochium trichocladiopsis]KAH7024757.1 CoA-transferase family III domain-containing protein [Microdochium trichocladiopsis]